MKISIIGAGNVGATCAEVLAKRNIGNEIVLLDTIEGTAEGKAIDISQSITVYGGHGTKIKGITDDYSLTSNSNIIVITAGLKRKPTMTREGLIKSNSRIVGEISKKAIKYSPKAIFIVVSNPLDVMTHQVSEITKLPRNKIIGMAGVLDSTRYINNLSKTLNISPSCINALIIGSHNDEMVILPKYTTVSGIPITHFLKKEEIENIINKSKKGGREIIDLIGMSAWYAPGASVAKVVEAIVKDQRLLLTASVKLEGEYNTKDCCIGVPIVIGKNGIEEIIEIPLNKEEESLFENAVTLTRKRNLSLK